MKKKKTHIGNIMRKAKVHKNEDLKQYNRRNTRKEEKIAQNEQKGKKEKTE